MKFKDTVENKQITLDKISKFVREYAKYKKIYKYVRTKKYKDSAGNTFDGITLNKTKLFLHTSYFKKYKKKFGMINTRGEKTTAFYTYLDEWFRKNHMNYIVAESITKKVFNIADKVTELNLIKINKMYKDLQRWTSKR